MNLSLLLPILVGGAGMYLLVKLKFFFLLHPFQTVREFLFGLKDKNAGRAFFLALAGTLGVGNIFGVAAGIMIGGAGSLFWLFLSSLFAMVIKYAETLLVFEKGATRGGMADLIGKSFAAYGKIFATIYAALTLFLSLFMGSAMQGAAFVDTSEKALGINPLLSAAILIIALIPAIIGGIRKIEKITEIIIPMTTIVYILMCLCVIIVNFSRLGCVLEQIINSAFNFKSAFGGCVSFAAVREGFARGILSNEAGVGTSALAHCRSTDRSAHRAGLFAMLEVFFDSTLMCMLTGIGILLVLPAPSSCETPMAMVKESLSSVFGGVSDVILPFVVFAFAYATIICWYFYGMECSSIYFPKISRFFPYIFVSLILFSYRVRSEILLSVIDVLLLFMALLTISVILKNTPIIEKNCRLSRQKSSDLYLGAYRR